jgi:hypothetical protein
MAPRDNTDEAADAADDHWTEHGDLTPAEVHAQAEERSCDPRPYCEPR